MSLMNMEPASLWYQFFLSFFFWPTALAAFQHMLTSCLLQSQEQGDQVTVKVIKKWSGDNMLMLSLIEYLMFKYKKAPSELSRTVSRKLHLCNLIITWFLLLQCGHLLDRHIAECYFLWQLYRYGLQPLQCVLWCVWCLWLACQQLCVHVLSQHRVTKQEEGSLEGSLSTLAKDHYKRILKNRDWLPPCPCSLVGQAPNREDLVHNHFHKRRGPPVQMGA
jgi:hypothetical protein